MKTMVIRDSVAQRLVQGNVARVRTTSILAGSEPDKITGWLALPSRRPRPDRC
jgi:hypothetical protein